MAALKAFAGFGSGLLWFRSTRQKASDTEQGTGLPTACREGHEMGSGTVFVFDRILNF